MNWGKHMSPFTPDNISEIFGSDAADTEDAARLYTFFISNDSYSHVRAPNPISLVVGQKGIGKTALMRVSALDDKRDRFPNIFIRGSRILASADASESGAATIGKFRAVIEEALLAEVADSIAKEAATALKIPDGIGSFLGRLTALGTAIATSQNDALKNAAAKATPWLLEKIPAVNVYIDDTDVDWDGSKDAASQVNRIIQSCFQIAADSDGDVRFKISVRSDLFNYLSVTSDIIDKVQSGVIRVRWTVDEIFRVIAKRIAIYEGKDYDDDEVDGLTQEAVFQRFFTPYFEDRFRYAGAWENAPMRQVLLSFVRQRPRDLIGLCRLAAKEAEAAGTIIDTRALHAVIPTYSQNRLNDTVVEFSNELPEIHKLLNDMRPIEQKKSDRGSIKKRHYYTNDQLIAKINNIKASLSLMFSYSKIPPTSAELAEFLFRINFLVASRTDKDGFVDRLYYDFADRHLREVRLGQWDWEVHMAYRWAIQRDSDAVWNELT